MDNSNTREAAFVDAANQYCQLVEQIRQYDRPTWLDRIGKALLSLEASIEQLQTAQPTAPYARISDFEDRFEIYSVLKEFLAEEDEYWSEGDLHASDGNKTGSLSDDFADIYFELQRGLMLYQQTDGGPANAVRLWVGSYRDHWRQHLVDARRQLFEFKPSNHSSQNRNA
jgi:hypothetical protein